MAFEATFCRGDNIQTMNYTPGGNVAAGEVVIVGEIVGIAVLPIAANALGSLNISGGTYIVVGDAAIAAGKNVWWNSTSNKITETASTHKYFGKTVSACAADLGTCEAMHYQNYPTLDAT